jgi:hypothetical protein
MRPYLAAQARTGGSEVAAIGVAQEYQNVFAATRREDRGRTGNQVWYSFYKAGLVGWKLPKHTSAAQRGLGLRGSTG